MMTVGCAVCYAPSLSIPYYGCILCTGFDPYGVGVGGRRERERGLNQLSKCAPATVEEEEEAVFAPFIHLSGAIRQTQIPHEIVTLLRDSVIARL